MTAENIVWGCIAAAWMIGVLCLWGGRTDTTEFFEHADWLADIAQAEAEQRRAREDAMRDERARSIMPESFTAGDRALLRELGIDA